MSAVLILVSVVIFGTAAGFVGSRKGRTSLGIGLGIVLGLIGLIIILCIPAKKD
jgi:hypothetical protein